MKRLVVFMFGILVFMSLVSAIEIDEEVIANVIIPELNQPAIFDLIVDTADVGTYNIYTLTDVRLLPSSPFYFAVGRNSARVYIYPTKELEVEGYYTFTYTLKKLDGESFDDKLTVKIVPLQDALEISSGSNNPDSGEVSFYVRNKEKARLENLKAKFSSVFFDFEESFSLDPFETKEFFIEVDKEEIKTIEAGTYIVKANFDVFDGIKKLEGKIYLGEKKGVETQEDNYGFLVRTNSVSKINIGNVVETVTIRVSKNLFTRLFTTLNHEPDYVDREGFVVTYTWNEKLEPAEIYTIKTKTNYFFPLLIIVFVALIVIGLQRFFKTDIEVIKGVSHVKTKGGQFALRVSINVKARKSVENVSIVDRIPSVVKVYEKFGTIKPDKIDAHNRRLHWNLGDLNAGEERAFDYVIYSKVGIVGKFALPSALGIYEKNNEIREIDSNIAFFLSEQVEKDE